MAGDSGIIVKRGLFCATSLTKTSRYFFQSWLAVSVVLIAIYFWLLFRYFSAVFLGII